MKSISILAMLSVVLMPVPELQAATITLGTQSPGALGENCIPFGCPGIFGISRYQEVYSSSAFAGPISILAVTLFNTTSTFPSETNAVTSGTYTFSFSTTSKPVGGLDTANLNNNVGANSQVFFSGAQGGPLVGTEFTVIGTTPFTYDRSLGNLLLNIDISSLGTDTITFFDSDQGPNVVLSRAFNGVPPETSNGLVTRFEFSAVPEPGTLLLLVSGLTALSVSVWGRSVGSSCTSKK